MIEPFLKEREQFLRESYSKSTVKKYKEFFSKFNKYESMYGQPFYNFTYKEMHTCIESLIKTGSLSTSGSLDTQKSILTYYIDWAKAKKELDTSRSQFNFKQLLEEEAIIDAVHEMESNTIIDREKIYQLISKSENYQYCASCILAFEGIDGGEHIEMRSLKVEDCDFINNKIKIIRNNKELTYTLPLSAMQIIKKAADQKKCENLPLVDSGFILKKTKVGKGASQLEEDDKRIQRQRITYRITRLIKSDKDIKNLDTDILQKSGIINYLTLIESINRRTPNKIEYYKVCQRFGVNPKNWFSYKTKYEYLKKHDALNIYDINELSEETKIILQEIYLEEINIHETIGSENKNDIQSVSRKSPSQPPERKSSDKKRWEENEKLGADGEYILLHYLKKQYSKVILAKDGWGYDIYAKNKDSLRCIEVKTMKNKHCHITITKNEYEAAHKDEYIDNYWFYILVWDNTINKNKSAELYIFKDLLGLIALRDKADILFKKTSTELNDTIWTHTDFTLQLGESVFNKNDEYKSIDSSFIEAVKMV